MDYELISAQDYENLPEDREQQFVEIEAICRRNMTKMIDNQTSQEFDSVVRMQYMTMVASTAEELGIKGVAYPAIGANSISETEKFLIRTSGVIARLRLRKSNKNRPLSVQLGVATKAKIDLQIQKLRRIIEESDISEGKRQKLFSKLDELSSELNQNRLNFAKVMAALAFISSGVAVTVAEGTNFLADAPQAIMTINKLIGQDKELEENEIARLGKPEEHKALPAPKPKLSESYQDFDTDDEIPF